jgi:hypothetical protein
MKRKYDPKLKTELERISREIEFEDFLANASQQMEALELIDGAYLRGEAYGNGFREGFIKARVLINKYDLARLENIRQKHDVLSKIWQVD